MIKLQITNYKQIQKAKLKNTLLLGVIVLASVLRLANLSTNPPSLYWEEAALGYDAYSILKTGKDYHGNPWPIVAFESFGDYKPSGYFYAAVPSLALFGLNEFAVRLPSALAGIMAVYLIYLTSLELGLKQKTSLLAALVLAINPWHIHFSRAAFEVNLATTLLLLSIWFLLRSKKQQYMLLPAAIFGVLSMYTYHGLRILAPLLMVWLAIPNSKKLLKSPWLYSAAVIAFGLCLPLLMAFNSPQIQQRFNETSLFSVSQAVAFTNAKRAECGNTFVCRAIYHRYWYWAGEVGQGVVRHFSPVFLVNGDDNARHQTSQTGPLYSWQLLALVIAFESLIRQRKTKKKFSLILYSLLGWLLLAAIPPALTKTTPHTLRFLPAAPAFALTAAIGLHAFYQSVTNRFNSPKATVIISLGIILISLNLVHYLYGYHWLYPRESSQQWQYGYKQAIQFVEERYPFHQKQVTRAYGRPSIYALFYGKQDPVKVQSVEPNVSKDQGELLQLENYNFASETSTATKVFISESNQNQGKLVKQINFLDGQPAFYIYETP